MSKYFNDTLRGRTGTSAETNPRPRTFEELMDAEAAPAPVVEAPPEQAQPAPKTFINISDFLERTFSGSDSIESARESYRGVRTRLLRLRTSQGLRSVMITSASQGEGKSLTSLNLAVCCAQLNDFRILLVDGDLRGKGLTRAAGALSRTGLAEVLAGTVEPEKAILHTDLPNLSILSSGTATQPSAELFAGRKWQDFIRWSSETYKLVLVDSPPILNLADAELMIAACDGVLMVVHALHTKRESLQKAASQIDAKKLLGAIYNGVETGAKNSYKHAYGYYDAATEKDVEPSLTSS